MSESNCPVSGRIAGFARVSHNERDDQSQVEMIEQFARRLTGRVRIVRIYRDPGRKRYELDESTEVAKMLDDAEDRQFDWLVVDRQSRLGTLHALQLVWFLNELLKRGVRVWSIAEGIDLTDVDGFSLHSTIANAQAEVKEQRDRAGNTARGMFLRAKRGHFTGGEVPYAYDRACYTAEGVLRFRAIKIGSEPNPNFDASQRVSKSNPRGIALYRVRHANGHEEITRGRPGKGMTDFYDFAPSLEDDKIATARLIFERYAEESVSPGQIARSLNRESPDAAMRGKWTERQVRSTLENPIYGGVRQYLHKRSAVYQTLDREGRYVTMEIGIRNRRKSSTVPPEERLYVERPDLAIIDPAIYARVQAKAKATAKTRAPRDDRFWLQPWLRCGCGGTMTGKKQSGEMPVFTCRSYIVAKRDGVPITCTPNRIKVSSLTSLLNRWLEEQGHALDMELSGARPALDQLRADQLRGHGLIARLREEMEKYVQDRLPEEQRDSEDFDVVATYREVFAAEQAAVQGKIDDASGQIARHSLSLVNFSPGTVAHQTIVDKINELQQDIDRYKERLTPLDEQIGVIMDQIKQTMQEIRAAQQHLAHRRHRRAAAVLGKILERIEVHSRPTGYGRGPLGQSRVEKVVFVPKLGAPTEYAVGGRDRDAIVEAVLTLRRKGLTLRGVADAMQDQGHPTVHAERWRFGSVRRILQIHAPELLGRASSLGRRPDCSSDEPSGRPPGVTPTPPAQGETGSTGHPPGPPRIARRSAEGSSGNSAVPRKGKAEPPRDPARPARRTRTTPGSRQ
jgi:DNA invertase Pin-like site-specific DNA recombinase